MRENPNRPTSWPTPVISRGFCLITVRRGPCRGFDLHLPGDDRRRSLSGWMFSPEKRLCRASARRAGPCSLGRRSPCVGLWSLVGRVAPGAASTASAAREGVCAATPGVAFSFCRLCAWCHVQDAPAKPHVVEVSPHLSLGLTRSSASRSGAGGATRHLPTTTSPCPRGHASRLTELSTPTPPRAARPGTVATGHARLPTLAEVRKPAPWSPWPRAGRPGAPPPMPLSPRPSPPPGHPRWPVL